MKNEIWNYSIKTFSINTSTFPDVPFLAIFGSVLKNRLGPIWFFCRLWLGPKAILWSLNMNSLPFSWQQVQILTTTDGRTANQLAWRREKPETNRTSTAYLGVSWGQSWQYASAAFWPWQCKFAQYLIFCVHFPFLRLNTKYLVAFIL